MFTQRIMVWFGLLGFNASATARVISRRWNDDEISSLVEETGVPGGNHRPTASHTADNAENMKDSNICCTFNDTFIIKLLVWSTCIPKVSWRAWGVHRLTPLQGTGSRWCCHGNQNINGAIFIWVLLWHHDSWLGAKGHVCTLPPPPPHTHTQTPW